MTLSVLYCLATGSAITDILKNKIFNIWLLIGALAGIILNFLDKEMNRPFKELVFKVVITVAILIPVYRIGGIGGGDLKLFTVIALFLPMGELMGCLMISFIVGAMLGIVKMIIKRNVHQTIHFAIPILISIALVTGNNALICM